MDSTTVERCIAAYFNAISAMDAEAVARCFREDAVAHDPVGAPPSEGPAAIAEFFRGIFGLISHVDIRPREVFAAGSGAAVRWHGEATGKNGQRASFGGIDVFEFDETGAIRWLRAYWDPALLMAAIAT